MKFRALGVVFTSIYLVFSSLTSFGAAGPSVWKMTYSVVDAEAAAEFCQKNLDMKRISIPDPTLAKGRAWVKFKDSELELHFVEAKKWRYGHKEIVKAYKEIDKLDQNMKVFTTFMDNHGAIMVDDLDPYLKKLKANKVPFLGPIRRDDGVHQLYIEVPGHLYLELDSRKAPKSVKAITWKDVDFGKK